MSKLVTKHNHSRKYPHVKIAVTLHFSWVWKYWIVMYINGFFSRSRNFLSPQATQYFLDKKLHTSCWSRARRWGGGRLVLGAIGALLQDVESHDILKSSAKQAVETCTVFVWILPKTKQRTMDLERVYKKIGPLLVDDDKPNEKW